SPSNSRGNLYLRSIAMVGFAHDDRDEDFRSDGAHTGPRCGSFVGGRNVHGTKFSGRGGEQCLTQRGLHRHMRSTFQSFCVARKSRRIPRSPNSSPRRRERYWCLTTAPCCISIPSLSLARPCTFTTRKMGARFCARCWKRRGKASW